MLHSVNGPSLPAFGGAWIVTVTVAVELGQGATPAMV